MATEDERRFLTLETKVAYQEKLLADLNDVMIEQQRSIDALTKRLQSVERLLREVPDATGPAHEKPPHY